MLDNKDNLTKEITLKKLSEEYDIDLDILRKEISFDEEEKKVIKKEAPIIKLSKYDKCVNNLLYYLMSDKKYLVIYNKQLGYLKRKEERELVTEIEYYIEKYGKISFADFISYAENIDNIKNLVNTISDSDINFEEELTEKRFLEYISSLKNIFNKEKEIKIKSEIKENSDINEKIKLVNKQIEIQRSKIKKGSGKDGRN